MDKPSSAQRPILPTRTLGLNMGLRLPALRVCPRPV